MVLDSDCLPAQQCFPKFRTIKKATARQRSSAHYFYYPKSQETLVRLQAQCKFWCGDYAETPDGTANHSAPSTLPVYLKTDCNLSKLRNKQTVPCTLLIFGTISVWSNDLEIKITKQILHIVQLFCNISICLRYTLISHNLTTFLLLSRCPLCP